MCTRLPALFGSLLLALPAARAHWLDYPRYPDWAQRGRMIYLDGTRATEEHLALVERYKAQGATPFIHAFTPHWPDDPAIVARLERAGIPVDVRVEGSLFFEDDHIDRFAFIHGRFLPGGWWYNHAWRTNYDWWRLFPESIAATTRRRNGDEKLAYAGHYVTVRREGSPLAPEHRSARAKQIAWLLAGVDPLPNVPMRAYENPRAKDPKVPYPMLGHYAGLWYDNPSSAPSYDVASRVAWEKHFKEKFGVEIADSAGHPDPAVRREWARFWADAWADYYLWRKQLQDDLLRKRGKPFCHTAGNFSFISQPHGTAEFWFARRGCVDMFGPSEYVPEWCRGRFHFLIKAAMAASHGRPAGKFYPNDLQIAESLAVCGTNTYRPEQAEFLAANVDLWANGQPGSHIAILFHVEHNLLESHIVDLQALVDQLTELGFPYEVVTEDDLGAEMAAQFALLIITQTDVTEDDVVKLAAYLAAGGRLLIIGDCQVMGPRTYDLNAPPRWSPPRTLAAALAQKGQDHALLEVHSPYPNPLLDRAVRMLAGPGFHLYKGHPDVLLNILRQPKGDLILANLVNYSGKPVSGLLLPMAHERGRTHAGWISRDGGAQMLSWEYCVPVPELRYGGTIILGRDRAAVESIIKRNAERFPLKPLPPDFKWASATQYGPWHARQIPLDAVAEDQTLCRHRVGATDRGGYLFLDAVAPKTAKVGEAAKVALRILETRYDHVEHWQLIFEDLATGEGTAVPIALPADNPYGEGGKLAGTTLSASWTPKKPGAYQAHLAYRVTRLHHDGEPFLGPDTVAAGYSGSTPANLFLKSQPLPKRPCEDRLRGLKLRVAEGGGVR